MLSKFIAKDILSGFERNVSDEKRGARWACLITVRLGTALGTILESTSVIGARDRKVDIECAVVDHGLMHLLLSLSSIGGRGEFDVAKSVNPSVIE